MIVGIEIEAVYNSERLSITRGSYHEGADLCDGWTAETDGSLDDYDEFELSDTVEFVSNTVNSKEKLLSLLDKLKNKLDQLAGNKKQRLNSILAFNDSCGAHIHFSFSDTYRCYDSLPTNLLQNAREYFFDGLNKLKIDERTKIKIKQRYGRDYSRMSTNRQTGDRRVEWNFCSEDDGKGMEWRSFNLTGVTKWSEMKSLYCLGWDTLEFLEKQAKSWAEPLTEEIVPINKVRKNNYSRLKINLDKKEPEEFVIEVKKNINDFEIKLTEPRQVRGSQFTYLGIASNSAQAGEVVNFLGVPVVISDNPEPEHFGEDNENDEEEEMTRLFSERANQAESSTGGYF